MASNPCLFIYIFLIVDIKENNQERTGKRCQYDIEEEIDRKFSDAWSAPIVPSKPSPTKRTKAENELGQNASPSFLRPKLIIRSDIFA